MSRGRLAPVVVLSVVVVSIAAVMAVNLITPPTRIIYRARPTAAAPRLSTRPNPPPVPVYTAAPTPDRAAELDQFAAACGRYLRQVDFRRLLDLRAPNAALFEYRHSMVGIITTYGLYVQGEASEADVLRTYRRHTRAIDALPGSVHILLVSEECYPETILGHRWEAIKQAFR